MAVKRKPEALCKIDGTTPNFRTKHMVIPDKSAREKNNGQGKRNPPTYLCKLARQEWFRIQPILEVNGVFTELDTTALAQYCALYVLWLRVEHQLGAHIANGGLLYQTSTQGKDVQHPLLLAAKQLNQDLARLAAEFGMTPASRSKAFPPAGKAPKGLHDKKSKFALPTNGAGFDPTADMTDGLPSN